MFFVMHFLFYKDIFNINKKQQQQQQEEFSPNSSLL
jgi:hypothetical protein